MKSSYIFAGLLAIIAVGWVLSGQFAEGNGVPKATKPPVDLAAVEKMPSVRVRAVIAERRVVSAILRGRTEAVRKVALKAETKGRIIELFVEEGEKVTKGTVIAKISPDDRHARLVEARALRELRDVEYKAAVKLSKKGFKAETKLVAAHASLEAAEAIVKLAEDELDKTTLRAPFAGAIDDRTVEIGDFVEPGDEIALLVDLNPILVVAQISERYHDKVMIGKRATARLVDGTMIEGKVRFVSSVADPATRTFRVELEVDNDEGRIPDGLTAELRIPLHEVPAYHLSPAVLTLADNGEIGVKAISETGDVAFHAATVIDSDPEGVWLAGLPSSLLLITVGQEFVSEGQKVKAVDDQTLETLMLGGAS